jgi:hypothetical protein
MARAAGDSRARAARPEKWSIGELFGRQHPSRRDTRRRTNRGGSATEGRSRRGRGSSLPSPASSRGEHAFTARRGGRAGVRRVVQLCRRPPPRPRSARSFEQIEQLALQKPSGRRVAPVIEFRARASHPLVAADLLRCVRPTRGGCADTTVRSRGAATAAERPCQPSEIGRIDAAGVRPRVPAARIAPEASLPWRVRRM